MSLKRIVLNSLRVLVVALPLASPLLFGQQFVLVNFPGATSTSVNGMDRNNAQVLVGNYVDDSGNTHGYILTGGNFQTLDCPGEPVTNPQDVNDLGQVVGQYYDTNNVSHGFIWNKGTCTTKDFPDVISSYAGGINNAGSIVGGYRDTNDIAHGFIYSGGKFSTVDVPGATGTGLVGINNQNHIAGSFTDAKGEHAFLLTNAGITTIDAPNSSDTFAQDLNNADEIVGGFVQNDQVTITQAFTYSAGIFTTVVYPGAFSTDLTSLSDSGVLTGGFTSDGGSGGFVRTNGPFAYIPTTSLNQTSVFDTATNLFVTSIPVGSGPIGAAVSPNGALVYVSNSAGGTVSAINPTTNTVISTIGVGPRPLGIAFTPDSASAYVANGSSNSLSVINTAESTVVTSVPVGSGPIFEAMAPNGKFVYVTNQFSASVSVISTASNTVVATIPLSSGPVGLAITPNGGFVYVTIPAANSVAVISTASNTVVTSVPVGAAPVRVSITPDGSTAYVSNQDSGNLISVIDVASNTVIANVTAGTTPYGSAITPDGALLWEVNVGSQNISVVSTASNQVVATLPLNGAASDLAIGSSPAVSQTITQPLSPTQPNQFNFGPHNFTVQYPPGTSFSGVNMSVTAAQTTQATFQQRVAGTQFANSACIVYSGAGGNCVDYQVTCSDTNGNPIPCPSTPAPNIDVKTSYDTLQTIMNPGFLTTPIGTNQWQSIFTAFYLQRIDPTTKGRTKGFSEFFGVDRSATNAQGPGTFTFLAPLRPTDPRVFGAGAGIPAAFQLVSVANPTHLITDALASLTLVMVSDANGNPQSNVVLAQPNAFQYQGGKGRYFYQINTTGYTPGTYILTVYGDAFAAQQVQFSIQTRGATTCTIYSSSPKFTNGQHIKFTAIAKPIPPGTGTPTGTITFIDSSYAQFVLGTAPLAGGSASINAVLHAPPNRQFIKAVYSGDNNFNVCQSTYIAEDYTPSE